MDISSSKEMEKCYLFLNLPHNSICYILQANLADTSRATIINIETGKSKASGLWKLTLELLQEKEDMLKALGQEPTFKGKGLK